MSKVDFQRLLNKLQQKELLLQTVVRCKEILTDEVWRVIEASIANQERSLMDEFVEQNDPDQHWIGMVQGSMKMLGFFRSIPRRKAAELVDLQREVQGLRERIKVMQDRGLDQDFSAAVVEVDDLAEKVRRGNP